MAAIPSFDEGPRYYPRELSEFLAFPSVIGRPAAELWRLLSVDETAVRLE
jgi:hypothetical protein